MTQALLAPPLAGGAGGRREGLISRCRSGLALRWILVAWFLRGVTPDPAGSPAQSRLTRRAAARLVVALGVRVEVVAPPAVWPRAGRGRLVVADYRSWVELLALLVVVPGVPVMAGRSGLPRALVRTLGAVVVRADAPDERVAVAAVRALLGRGATVLVPLDSIHEATGRLAQLAALVVEDAFVSGIPVCPVGLGPRCTGDQPTSTPRDRPDLSWRKPVHGVDGSRRIVELQLLPPLERAAVGVPYSGHLPFAERGPVVSVPVLATVDQDGGVAARFSHGAGQPAEHPQR